MLPPATADLRPTAVLLDIEGTTTPADFVYKVLFPYAREHAREFLSHHRSDPVVSVDINVLRREHSLDSREERNPPSWRDHSAESELESIVAYVHWLMDQDRKSTPLKSLQGKIWEAGYRSGELRGEVYADVPPAFSRWRDQAKDVCIFSSGSVLAQKLLFAHTLLGDLTPLIREYFDTSTAGPKTEADSYRRIASALEMPPQDILFISDVIAELDAARVSGMDTAMCVRPGRPTPESATHPRVQTFDEVFA